MLCPAPPALPQPPRLGWDRFLSSWSQHPARLLPCQPLPAPPACPSCLPPPAPSPSHRRRSRERKASLNSQVSAAGQRRPGDRGHVGGGGVTLAVPAGSRHSRGSGAPRPLEGSPAPARYGRRAARTSSSHSLRRGRGVPASPGDAERKLAALVPEAAPAAGNPHGPSRRDLALPPTAGEGPAFIARLSFPRAKPPVWGEIC